MSDDDEEIYIEHIGPLSGSPPDELSANGLVKFKTMTKKEFQEKYPSDHYGKFVRKIYK
jgi:hypothetical protein